MSEYDLGWLAGIIDGEGTLQLNKKTSGQSSYNRRGFSWQVKLEIPNTDMKILNRAQSIIGTGKVYRHGSRNPRHKPAYSLNVFGRTLRVLLPRLKLVGKEQHRILLVEALSLLAQHRPTKTPHDGRLEEICAELHRLNKRGQASNTSREIE